MKLLTLILGGALVCGSLYAADKKEKPPEKPFPPLTFKIRPADGDYGPDKWKWEYVGEVKDPVNGETLFIGGRVGGAEFGHIGHWALGADGKSWRELTPTSAVLEPLRQQVLAARKPARLSEGRARQLYYDAREQAQELELLKKEPLTLLQDAIKQTTTVLGALKA